MHYKLREADLCVLPCRAVNHSQAMFKGKGLIGKAMPE